MLVEHFEAVENLVTEKHGDVFSKEELMEIQEEANSRFMIDEEEFSADHKQDADLKKITDIRNLFNTYLLAKQLTSDVLAHLIKNDAGKEAVLKSILHDIRKSCPLVYWNQMEIDIPELEKVEVEDI